MIVYLYYKLVLVWCKIYFSHIYICTSYNRWFNIKFIIVNDTISLINLVKIKFDIILKSEFKFNSFLHNYCKVSIVLLSHLYIIND